MLNILFLGLFFSTMVFAYIQLRVTGEFVNKVSVVNVTAIALFMFSIIGVLPLFYYLDDYRYSTGIQDKNTILLVLLFSCLNIIFFLSGVVFFRKILRFQPVSFRSQEIKPIITLQKKGLVILFLFCVIVLIDYLQRIDTTAIFVALTQGVEAAKQARSNMGNSFSGSYHWYSLVMRDIGSLITFVSFSLWLIEKKLLALMAFCITFSYSVFVAVMATEKAPLAWLLIGLFMVYYLVRRDGVVPFKKIVAFSFAIIIILVALYIYFMGSAGVGSALWSVFSRAFSGSIAPAYYYLEFFPNQQDYLLGGTFPNPGGLMPYEPYLYTIEVINWVFPSLAGSGVVGSAPTVFWGEAYANFGPGGVPVIAFIVGCFVALVSYLVSKMEVNPITIGFTVWVILFFKDLSVSGFSGYFYNVYLFSITFCILLLLSFKGSIRVRRR